MITRSIIIICFSLYLNLFSQEINLSSFSLSGINTGIKITNIPDSLEKVTVKFVKSGYEKKIDIKIKNGIADTSVVFQEAGYYKLASDDFQHQEITIRVMPGWFSIVPPLIAILLALIIRQVITALVAGIYIGAIFIYNYDPFLAVLRFTDTIVIDSLANHDHLVIIVFTLLFGGVIGIISKNGGTLGLSNVVTKIAKTARTGMIASWIMGLIIFFDDYANSLIIGNMMRPITDKLKVSREKLAYIVDSTSAPVASIFIISSWIGFELGLIDAGLKAIGSTQNAYDVFISTIPYRFYPIAALFFVFLTSYLKRDFGPMYHAEHRARTKGELFERGSFIEELKEDETIFKHKEKARWFNAAIPISIIVFGTTIALILTGINKLEAQGITEYSLRDIIGNADSFSSLLWSSFFACVVAIIMTVSQKILSLNDSINGWSKGLQSMLFACVILVFAWAISAITTELKTADYLISILSDAIDPRFLPVLVFLICALISFSTGTSWGTMAIVMPIVIPLAYKLAHSFGWNLIDTDLIINGVVSSVLAGSVFGDHCSPIADTTILSSIASGSNHIDHVKTQLPYAILVGVVCMLLGDLATAFFLNPYLAIILIFGVLTVILLLIGKKVPDFRTN